MRITKKILKYILIPFGLLVLWLLLSLSYSSYRSFTVLQYPQDQDQQNNFAGKQILKGQKITGTFAAKENNLGIVAIKFGELPPVDSNIEDTVLFRIKEKGKTGWFYENKFTGLQFNSNSYFPFGFKSIGDSKGKIYTFELISLNGNRYNALKLATEDPMYFTKYKFSKREIFGSHNFLKEFLTKKVQTFFAYKDILLSSSIFMLPLIFYLTLLAIPRFLKLVDYEHKDIGVRNLIFKKKSFAYLTILLIFAYFIFMKTLFTGFILGLLFFWLVAIYINKFNSKATFLLAFSIIIVSLLGTYFEGLISINISTAFAYMLFLIGFVQSVFEYKKIYFFK